MAILPRKAAADEKERRQKQLGARLQKLREKRGFSLRELGAKVGTSAPNLLHLEKGYATPTPQVYEKMLAALSPNPGECGRLDTLYSELRELPPPDVCKVLLANSGLNEALRMLRGVTLTGDQLRELRETLLRFRPPDDGGGEAAERAAEDGVSTRPMFTKKTPKKEKEIP